MTTDTDVPTRPHPPIPGKTLEGAAQVLKVLGHPARLRIIELLLTEAMKVGDLADCLALAPHAVSQHLNMMKVNGILDSQRQGREVYYRVINPNAVNVIECIRRHGVGDDKVHPGGERI